MLELINKTPFQIDFSPITNLEGYEELAVFLAASFILKKGQWHVCARQMPTPMGDSYWNPDAPSSIQYPGQLGTGKPATDIIVNGAAVAPETQAVTALEASAEVGALQAKVHVYGDRAWHRGRITAPRPFRRIPLVWENAYGGAQRVNNTSIHYEHNAHGKGWLPDDTADEAFEGVLLPNVEWPHALIRQPRDRPMPAGFGALAVDTPTRAQYAGTYDQHWQTTRSPFAPMDFNPTFFCAAIPALRYPGFMSGNEPVRLRNLNAVSDIAFRLPSMAPGGQAVTRTGDHRLTFRLLTLIIESETLTVRLFWQALAPIARTLADIYQIKVVLNTHK